MTTQAQTSTQAPEHYIDANPLLDFYELAAVCPYTVEELEEALQRMHAEEG